MFINQHPKMSKPPVWTEMQTDIGGSGGGLGIQRRRGAIKHQKIYEHKGHKFIAKFFRYSILFFYPIKDIRTLPFTNFFTIPFSFPQMET